MDSGLQLALAAVGQGPLLAQREGHGRGRAQVCLALNLSTLAAIR